jgi:hypothetical protein
MVFSSDRLTYNVCVYLVAGVGGFKNVAQRNVKPDHLRNSPPLHTKLRNQFELAHRTPQLNKHAVVARSRPPLFQCRPCRPKFVLT